MSRGDNVQIILGAIGRFWVKWGYGTSPAERKLFCVVNHATFRQLCNGQFSPNLVTKRISMSRRGTRKDIFENVHFWGHMPPKSGIESRSNRHLTQSRLQVTRCSAKRYRVLHVVVQGTGSFRDRSTFFYDVRLRSYGASNLPNIQISAFFPIQSPPQKKYLPVSSLQPRGYIAE